MIELTRINLLPYREEIKQRKQQQFKILMLGAFAVGLGLAAVPILVLTAPSAIKKAATTSCKPKSTDLIENWAKSINFSKKKKPSWPKN